MIRGIPNSKLPFAQHSVPMTRFTMHRWNTPLSGSWYAIRSSSFSIFRISSSASSFWFRMM